MDMSGSVGCIERSGRHGMMRLHNDGVSTTSAFKFAYYCMCLHPMLSCLHACMHMPKPLHARAVIQSSVCSQSMVIILTEGPFLSVTFTSSGLPEEYPPGDNDSAPQCMIGSASVLHVDCGWPCSLHRRAGHSWSRTAVPPSDRIACWGPKAPHEAQKAGVQGVSGNECTHAGCCCMLQQQQPLAGRANGSQCSLAAAL